MRLNPLLALTLLVLVNLVAFFGQGLDKWRAKRGTRRTPETTLLMLGVPLAAAGMWLGMRVFNHKVSKVTFLIGAWIVTGLNLLLAWGVFWAMNHGWLELGMVGRPS